MYSMWNLFYDNDVNDQTKYASFNSDLSKWNTTQCINFNNVFTKAASFNTDISKWEICKNKKIDGITVHCSIAAMFLDATSFNVDISKWRTGALFCLLLGLFYVV